MRYRRFGATIWKFLRSPLARCALPMAYRKPSTKFWACVRSLSALDAEIAIVQHLQRGLPKDIMYEKRADRNKLAVGDLKRDSAWD